MELKEIIILAPFAVMLVVYLLGVRHIRRRHKQGRIPFKDYKEKR